MLKDTDKFPGVKGYILWKSAACGIASAHRRFPSRSSTASRAVTTSAAACALTPEEVAVCEQADVSVDSLERELSGGGRLGDLVGDEGMEERTCLYLSLEEALLSLPERERQVIALRFARDMTQQQVSRIIGVSQVQVSRIEKRALAALREKLCDT